MELENTGYLQTGIALEELFQELSDADIADVEAFSLSNDNMELEKTGNASGGRLQSGTALEEQFQELSDIVDIGEIEAFGWGNDNSKESQKKEYMTGERLQSGFSIEARFQELPDIADIVEAEGEILEKANHICAEINRWFTSEEQNQELFVGFEALRQTNALRNKKREY
ncbi:hypothetical protein KP509_13G023000 [Ceratopteris richardii]|uniref:Uncharacterized protein n=1 Tax=Ceratopteris richardii TaxID=49495 RepID=A0A8T2TG95_CERRI|nr:hypothetical protein KP509_13G023000 [Ceratopteris richardii]